jgi:hypothetical protein
MPARVTYEKLPPRAVHLSCMHRSLLSTEPHATLGYTVTIEPARARQRSQGGFSEPSRSGAGQACCRSLVFFDLPQAGGAGRSTGQHPQPPLCFHGRSIGHRTHLIQSISPLDRQPLPDMIRRLTDLILGRIK